MKNKITLQCLPPNQLSLTLGAHHFRHLPMHEKTLLLSHSVRWWTGEQFSSVPWVVIFFQLHCKPVFAYDVPVYFYALLRLHNSPLLFILLILKWKAVFTLLFSLTWSGWILPPSYSSSEHFLPLLTTTLKALCLAVHLAVPQGAQDGGRRGGGQ